jgi:SAM-dependent methyltransferase
MVPTLFAPWASRLVQAADPQPAERVLDLACGTGIVARQVAARLGTATAVTGLDLSPQMLDVARAAATRERAPVEWLEGRAEALPFADACFDAVFCQFGLMFFADRAAALGEIRRVLRPGGRFLASVWQGLDRHPFYLQLDEVIQRRLGTSALQQIFALGDLGTLGRLFADAGFAQVEIEPMSLTSRFPNPDGFLAGEIDVDTAAIPSLQGLDDAARQAMLEAIRDDMQAPLRDVTQGDHVVIPFHAYVVRARR